MTSNILELFAKRHSFYDINDNIPVDTNVIDIVKEAMNIYPSSFNAQEARLVLLLGENHKKFWDITKNKLLQTAPQDKHTGIDERINSFSKGFGTILYFIDINIVKDLEQKYSLYAENFTTWANQSNAMLQYMIWTAFANQQIGASLQHYNPLIDEEIKKEFNIPESWQLVAQMPFGGIASTPKAHKTENLESKLTILK